MPHITAQTRAILWAVGDPVIETGITHVGELTVTGLTLFSGEDENSFLASVVGKATNYNPLPDVGEFVEAGIYGWQGGLVVVRQPHTRQHDPGDAGVGALYGIYRPGVDVWEWVAGEVLQVGARRSYEGVVYELYRDIGANNWSPPPQVAAHWRVVVETPGEWAVGVAYKGDNTEGAGNGDTVTYQGAEYRCLQSHTSQAGWTPTAVPALWQDLGAL